MDEIGTRLREARMRAQIDIDEVETRTKIRAKYLRAMENEEWDLLPGEVYVRSFLRTYGDFLGLDTRQLLDDFRRRYESPTDHEPPPIVPPGRERHERERRGPRAPRGFGVPPWALIGVVLVAVAVVLYIVGTGNNSPNKDSTPPRSALTTSHHTPLHRRHRVVRHVAARPRSVRLAMVPTGPGPVYVCLVNGAGKILIPGTIYDTGETIPTESGGKLLLTLGNASMTVKANGVIVPVAASSGAIGLQFTPGRHSLLPASKQPTCTS